MIDTFIEVPISKIESIENIRMNIKERDVSELMQNIKQNGLLQPIGVWETKAGEFIIAFGNRRLMACEKLGWTKITAKILGALTAEELLIINASENLHRKDVTVAELGRIIFLLHEKGLSLGEISVRLGVTRQKVDVSVELFHNIAPEHRKDVVFMKAGTKLKMGKIPATSYNHLFSVRQECGMSKPEFNKLVGVVKKENLSYSQIKVIGILLMEGATLHDTLKTLDKYNMRRINLAINKNVEAALIKKHNIEGQGQLSALFRMILSGEISGTPTLVYNKSL